MSYRSSAAPRSTLPQRGAQCFFGAICGIGPIISLIRRRYEDDKLRKMPVGKAIAELIEEDGGPLIWPRITETEQNSFDATCRKLYKFLNSTAKIAR